MTFIDLGEDFARTENDGLRKTKTFRIEGGMTIEVTQEKIDAIIADHKKAVLEMSRQHKILASAVSAILADYHCTGLTKNS